MEDWNPNQYLKFGSERTQPAIDLLNRVSLDSPNHIIDLGCGPGNSTTLLKQRWASATVSGLDSSAKMIQKAKLEHPSINWIHQDVSEWNPDKKYDLVFSNAALQWVEDHAILFPKLYTNLEIGGQLAVQLPYHWDSSLNLDVVEVSKNPEWDKRMGPARTALIRESISFYYDLVSSVAEDFHIWTTEYYHIMESHKAILEWISGTGLRPYMELLETEQERDQFKNQLLQRFENSYSKQIDGKIIFPFKRLFILATRTM